MRSRIATFAVALFAVVALSAIAVGSASADEWFIGGAKLAAGQSAALATTAPVDEFAKLRINPGSATTEVALECTGANLIGGEAYISGGTSGMAKSLTFEKCKVTKPATGCELEPEVAGGTKNLRSVRTNALGVTTTLSTAGGTKVSINIHPLTKKTFVELPFTETSTCLGGGGDKPVNGAVSIASSDGTSEEVTHRIQALGSLENNSLEVAGNKAIIEGGLALVKLASGSKWSFHA
jgi:hypothetical protein